MGLAPVTAYMNHLSGLELPFHVYVDTDAYQRISFGESPGGGFGSSLDFNMHYDGSPAIPAITDSYSFWVKGEGPSLQARDAPIRAYLQNSLGKKLAEQGMTVFDVKVDVGHQGLVVNHGSEVGTTPCTIKLNNPPAGWSSPLSLWVKNQPGRTDLLFDGEDPHQFTLNGPTWSEIVQLSTTDATVASTNSKDAVIWVRASSTDQSALLGGGKATVVKLDMLNPIDRNGNGKVDDPGPPGNEFTYTADNPGRLEIPVVIRVTPDVPYVRMLLDGNIHVEMSEIRNSQMVWTNSVPGQATVGSAVYNFGTGSWNTQVTFTGLPVENSDFGEKTVTVEVFDKDLQTTYAQTPTQIEVFWPLLINPEGAWGDSNYAKNHPSNFNNANWPNWMYYWLQTVTPLGTPPPTFAYSPTQANTYIRLGSTVITLSSTDCWPDFAAPYAGQKLDGIDNFAWTVIHESQHYVDHVNFWSNSLLVWLWHIGGTGDNDDKDWDKLPNWLEWESLGRYDWEQKLTARGAGDPPSLVTNDFEDLNCWLHSGVRGNHSLDWSQGGFQYNR